MGKDALMGYFGCAWDDRIELPKAAMRRSVHRGSPHGDESWSQRAADCQTHCDTIHC